MTTLLGLLLRLYRRIRRALSAFWQTDLELNSDLVEPSEYSRTPGPRRGCGCTGRKHTCERFAGALVTQRED